MQSDIFFAGLTLKQTLMVSIIMLLINKFIIGVANFCGKVCFFRSINSQPRYGLLVLYEWRVFTKLSRWALGNRFNFLVRVRGME